MKLLKHELRAGLKPFLFWTLGLFVLVFAGMTKYTGIEGAPGGVNLNDLLDQFPRVVLAVMGMVDVDINTLGGYYSVLAYYALICAVIYGVHIGTNAVSREAVDKTYEFVFTKPRTRAHILFMKLAAGWLYLAVFCVLNYLFSVGAIATLNISEPLRTPILLYSVSLFLIGSVFVALAAFLSAAVRRAEKGSLYGNVCFVSAFILGIVYDLLDNGGALKLISPLKYFSPADLLSGRLDPLYSAICMALTALLLWGAFERFGKKDLSEK